MEGTCRRGNVMWLGLVVGPPLARGCDPKQVGGVGFRRAAHVDEAIARFEEQIAALDTRAPPAAREVALVPVSQAQLSFDIGRPFEVDVALAARSLELVTYEAA